MIAVRHIWKRRGCCSPTARLFFTDGTSLDLVLATEITVGPADGAISRTSSVDTLDGGGNDVLFGNGGANFLIGDDLPRGGDGNDLLYGRLWSTDPSSPLGSDKLFGEGSIEHGLGNVTISSSSNTVFLISVELSNLHQDEFIF